MHSKVTHMYFYLFYMWCQSFVNKMTAGTYETWVWEAFKVIIDEQFWLVCSGEFVKRKEDLEDPSVRKRAQSLLYNEFMSNGRQINKDGNIGLSGLEADADQIPMIFKLLGMKTVHMWADEKGIWIQFNGNDNMKVYLSSNPINPQISIDHKYINTNNALNQVQFESEFSQALRAKKDLYR